MSALKQYRVNEPCLFPIDCVPGGCQPPYVAVEVYKAADVELVFRRVHNDMTYILEYWNGNHNERAMVNALERIEQVAQRLLAELEGKG